MRRVFIGLGGKPRHGKDSAARAMLAEAVRLGARAEALSISELICAELGLRREDVRDLGVLQEHSHRRCAKDPFYWTRQIARAAQASRSEIVLLTNVRRRDEAEYLRVRGWRLARVIALNEDGSLYTPWPADRDLNDPLETQLDHYNWEFRLIARKPGQLGWLEAQAAALVRHLLAEEPEATR